MRKRQGKRVQAQLVAQGLPARVRQRDGDGVYIAEFADAESERPTLPAWYWAACLRALLPGTEVIEAQDTLAPWRGPGYVLVAAVHFRRMA